MALSIVLSNTAGVPIYEQIKAQLTASILRGDLAEGDALPSIRGLARDLQVSVITTTRAYADLAGEGFIVNVPGKGSYVAPRNTDLVREQILRDVERHFGDGVRHARLASLTPVELHEVLDAIIANQEES